MFKVIMLPPSALVGQAPGSSTFPDLRADAPSDPTRAAVTVQIQDRVCGDGNLPLVLCFSGTKRVPV
jgi:hypothetical protein